ncbi:PH domain-containing protein [Alteribacter natronophilus]|uniref:PH domain-containing protein n=1 Tax=Alteribacter natronophilus TaxID=2583810 RepID=UPI00110ED92F|nr:PH domain-containing protein [Alteribacter natronophilus]TMW71006.1 hypothetical protein FGB90_13615 [Alteribacter natronophilus]
MVFLPKRIRGYWWYSSAVALLVVFSFFIPAFHAESQAAGLFFGITGLIATVFFVWTAAEVKYILDTRGLKVKAGPFRSVISYDRITLVAPAKDTMGGFRMMLSPGGIQIHYEGGFNTDVKISPGDQAGFVRALKDRCPGLKIDSELAVKIQLDRHINQQETGRTSHVEKTED